MWVCCVVVFVLFAPAIGVFVLLMLYVWCLCVGVRFFIACCVICCCFSVLCFVVVVVLFSCVIGGVVLCGE